MNLIVLVVYLVPVMVVAWGLRAPRFLALSTKGLEFLFEPDGKPRTNV